MLIDEVYRWGPELTVDLPPPDDVAVFEVSEVERYLSGLVPPDQYVELSFHDLPTLAPLGPAMWFELTVPARLVRAVGISAPLKEDTMTWGVLVQTAIDRDDPAQAQEAAVLLEGARWLLMMEVFGAGPRLGRVRHKIATCCDIAPDGALLGWDTVRTDGKPRDRADKGLIWPEYVALTALCFCHCKNVQMVEHQQSRQQRRSAQRAGHPPLVTYRTIEIGPVQRVLRDKGHVETQGLKRALHTVRGHFAYYPDEEGRRLFGKYSGTYYVPLHLRGTLRQGKVVKHYRVVPPQDAAAGRKG